MILNIDRIKHLISPDAEGKTRKETHSSEEINVVLMLQLRAEIKRHPGFQIQFKR